MQSRRLPCLYRIALLAFVCLRASEGGQLWAIAAMSTEASLIGTSWLAEDIGGRGVVDGVYSTLIFESEERVSGSSGCNRYQAPLQLSGTALRLGMASTTRRACPPAVMDQERRFLAALDAARTYRRDGSTLWLFDGTGETLLRLTLRATATERGEPSEAAPAPPP
jgi:heat shock protein HslJ